MLSGPGGAHPQNGLACPRAFGCHALRRREETAYSAASAWPPSVLREVRFEYRHTDCWMQETSERFPTLTLVISGLYMKEKEIHADCLVHSPDRKTVQEAEVAWTADKRIRKVSKLYEGPRGTRFHVAYSQEHTIYPYILNHTPLSMGAVSVAGGVEHYHIIGAAEDIQDLLKELGKEGTVKVQSTRMLDAMPTEAEPGPAAGIVGLLTDKQIDALLLAHAEGYYQWPRELSASELAGRLGLSSSAFLEHLRHAESKVLNTVVDELKRVDPGRFQAAKARLAVRKAEASATKAKKAAK